MKEEKILIYILINTFVILTLVSIIIGMMVGDKLW